MRLSSLPDAIASGDCNGSPLTVTVDVAAGQIDLSGELNSQTAHHLLDALPTLQATGHSPLVLNTHGLRVCDRRGLRVLGVCYRQALAQGARMNIVGASPSLRRALSVMRLDTHVIDPDL